MVIAPADEAWLKREKENVAKYKEVSYVFRDPHHQITLFKSFFSRILLISMINLIVNEIFQHDVAEKAYISPRSSIS